MNQRWTPGSGAVVTRFPITKKDVGESNQNNLREEESVEENYRFSTSEDIHSILFAFAVVFSYFSGVCFLKNVGELTFDNFIVLTILVCLVAEFIRIQRKKHPPEIIDFKEPKI